MMKIRLVSAAIFLVAAHASALAEGEPSIYESATPPTPTNQLDRIVFAKLSSLGFRQVLCSDAVFVRRAYLDLIGTLPTAREAREFIQDPDAKNKRTALIDRLLQRDEFVDYWAMRWGDVLRRRAADQGGVPRQPLAQRSAGVSPLGTGLSRREQAV